VLDDAEGRFNQYSYDILLGQKEAKPAKEGSESTAERTLRLFYVCCSRATADLAVAYFTADPDKAYADLLTAELFAPEDIYRVQDLAVG
jgi:DNA helicase-2/ATP-dependent DNA helicase PcrA